MRVHPINLQALVRCLDWSQLGNLATAVLLAGLAGALAHGCGASGREAAGMVLTGSIAGWITNVIAVRLLFSPLTPRLGGRLHGVFYKRRDAFGDKLIKSSCERILNPQFFEKLLLSEAVRRGMGKGIRDELDRLLKADIGSPRQALERLFPPDQIDMLVDRAAVGMGNLTCAGLEGFFADPAANRMLGIMGAELDQLRLNEVVTPERTRQFAGALARSVGHPEFKGLLRDMFRRLRERLSQDTRPIRKLLGDPQQVTLHAQAVSLATHRLKESAARLLKNRQFRCQAQKLVSSEVTALLQKQLNRSSGFRGLILSLIASANAAEIQSETRQAVAVGLDRLVLRLEQNDPLVEAMLRQAADQFVGDLLEMPLGKIAALVTAPALDQLLDSALQFLLSGPGQTTLSEGFADALARFGDQPIGLLTTGLFGPADGSVLAVDLGGFMSRIVRKESLRCEVRVQIRTLLVGVAGLRLPSSELMMSACKIERERVETRLVRTATERVCTRVPAIAASLPVRHQLRAQWDSLSNVAIRDAVLGVLGNEFRTLINWGISLGAVAGAFSYGLMKLVLASFK